MKYETSSILPFRPGITFTGQQQYYPDSNWQTRKPAELQMNQSVIDSAVRFALS